MCVAQARGFPIFVLETPQMSVPSGRAKRFGQRGNVIRQIPGRIRAIDESHDPGAMRVAPRRDRDPAGTALRRRTEIAVKAYGIGGQTIDGWRLDVLSVTAQMAAQIVAGDQPGSGFGFEFFIGKSSIRLFIFQNFKISGFRSHEDKRHNVSIVPGGCRGWRQKTVSLRFE